MARLIVGVGLLSVCACTTPPQAVNKPVVADTSITAPVRRPVTPELQSAQALLDRNQFAEAASAFKAALTQKPNFAPAYEGLGLALLGMQDKAGAFPVLSQAVHLQPDLPRAEFALAHLYYEASFYPEAQRRLASLLKRYPTNAQYIHAFGLCLGRDDQHNVQSEFFLKTACDLAPDKPGYHIDLGDIQVRTGKSRDAETHYREALRLAPDQAATQIALGNFLTDHVATPAALAEAEPLYRTAFTHTPNNADAAYRLGNLLLKRGSAKDAIPYLEKAVVRTPGLPQPWYALTRAYQRVGNRARADYCQKTYKDVSTFGRRLALAEEETQLHKKDSKRRVEVARLFAKGHDYARAINQYQIALYLDPANTAIRRELAQFVAQLKATNQLPNMMAFDAMLRTHSLGSTDRP